MGETGKFDQKDGFTAFSNIRFPEGKVFGSVSFGSVSFCIVSVFVVEGSAQGDPPPQQHQHHQSPQPLQHSSGLIWMVYSNGFLLFRDFIRINEVTA